MSNHVTNLRDYSTFVTPFQKVILWLEWVNIPFKFVENNPPHLKNINLFEY